MLSSSLPDLPWQKVGTDLFEWKRNHYLLIVDYFSRFIEISKLTRTTSEDIIAHTKSIFARHGIPEVVYSDNGPQFRADVYKQFAVDYQFKHVTSSPYFPQSNGEAERAVGTIKNLLKKEGDPYLALLAYRSTPLEIGYSPSQLLMNRALRTTVPMTRSLRQPEVPNLEEVKERDALLKNRQKRNFDKHHGTRELPLLNSGQLVWLPESGVTANVGEQVAPRSYLVNTPQGQIRRNRRNLILIPNTPNTTVATNPSPSCSPSVRKSTRMSCPPKRLISDPNWT